MERGATLPRAKRTAPTRADMLLAIDVGNTDIKLGVFDGERLCSGWRWSTDRARMADEYAVLLGWALSHHELSFSAITRAVLCSVVPSLTGAFSSLCERYLHQEPLVVTAAVETGVRLAVDNPAEVGGDRIANVVAASHLYGSPSIVVDFGTATNFDVVGRDGARIVERHTRRKGRRIGLGGIVREVE